MPVLTILGILCSNEDGELYAIFLSKACRKRKLFLAYHFLYNLLEHQQQQIWHTKFVSDELWNHAAVLATP